MRCSRDGACHPLVVRACDMEEASALRTDERQSGDTCSIKDQRAPKGAFLT